MAAARLVCPLVLWVVVLLFEALMGELEAGLGQLALVGNGVFLGHALGGWEGMAHLHRWLVCRAVFTEVSTAGCGVGWPHRGQEAPVLSRELLERWLYQDSWAGGLSGLIVGTGIKALLAVVLEWLLMAAGQRGL